MAGMRNLCREEKRELKVLAQDFELYDRKDVKIILQNGYEMTALTGKTTVKEVLEENNIVLEENQKTIPDQETEIEAGQTIQITDKSYNEVQISKISEEGVLFNPII